MRDDDIYFSVSVDVAHGDGDSHLGNGESCLGCKDVGFTFTFTFTAFTFTFTFTVTFTFAFAFAFAFADNVTRPGDTNTGFAALAFDTIPLVIAAGSPIASRDEDEHSHESAGDESENPHSRNPTAAHAVPPKPTAAATPLMT